MRYPVRKLALPTLLQPVSMLSPPCRLLPFPQSFGEVRGGEQPAITDRIHIKERPILSDAADDQAITRRLGQQRRPGLPTVIEVVGRGNPIGFHKRRPGRQHAFDPLGFPEDMRPEPLIVDWSGDIRSLLDQRPDGQPGGIGFGAGATGKIMRGQKL